MRTMTPYPWLDLDTDVKLYAPSMTRPTRIRLTDPLASASDLTGRRAIVTGGSSGLGLVTARTLALRGADVIIGARDVERAQSARDQLVAAYRLTADRITVAPLDLIDQDSVRRFAESAGDAPLDLL